MRVSSVSMVILAGLAACGGKKEQAPAAGSAAPTGSPTPTGSAGPGAAETGSAAAGSGSAAAGSGSAAGAGSAADSGSGAGSGSAAGSGAGSGAMTVDPCTFATRDQVEAYTNSLTEYVPVPVTASVLGGCTYDTVNRQVRVEARPAADFATQTKALKKPKKVTKGFPTNTTAIEDPDAGDVYVSLEGKPYFLFVHADAGERSPTSVYAVEIAKILAPGAK